MGHLHTRKAFSALFVLALALAGGCGDNSSDSDSTENGGAGIGGAGMGVGGALSGVGGAPVGAGGTPVGAGGTPVGVGGTPVGVGGTPVGAGGTPVGAGGTPVGVGGTPVGVGGAGVGGLGVGGLGVGGVGVGGVGVGGVGVGGVGVGGVGVGGVGVGGEVALGGTGSGGEPATGGTAGDTGVGGDAGSAGEEAGGTGGVLECEVPTGSPGTPIVFNDDGGWCWYQDERAIVDPETNTLIIGSVAIGGMRNGDVEVTHYDLDGGGSPQRHTLGTNLSPDDHNTAGLLKLGSGRYVAMYTGHNENCYDYYNVYSNGSWGNQGSFLWTNALGCPTDQGRTISYTNLWVMGGVFYNFVRSTGTSPNLLTSTDGSNWSYAGRLTAQPLVGYVAGYYKYWGNNVDRIDFLATEAHPRDNDNSLYHGYVQNEQSFRSDGTVVDNTIMDGNAPDIVDFTTVFHTGSQLGPATLTHLWNCDIMRYDDGTIVAIFTGRAD
jgi:hypothetical protein